MAEYEKKVRSVLRENGCLFVRRGKGDHDIWQKSTIPKEINMPPYVAEINYMQK